MRLLSPESVAAIIGVIWCAKVLDSFSSDWSNFHESQENSDRVIQILVWISAIIAAVVTGVIMFSLISTSLSELESWKRF
ncbi:hypothetical protein N8766_02595 [bacterium]|jgi:hypothetical protein|nr:hypothetical protein [Verrucomicrobiota bacterium]MDA7632974.1 hypothetical protein [bacterium]MDA7657877.1 hypothetical protein [Verrucomicrobiota bacterium]MDB4796889.1 hypothetical protein [bacterium]